MLMTTACSTSASASSRWPRPSARAIAAEMPPPIAPAEIVCISMTTGNTSAMPASASVPRRATQKVSISPVEACASMIRMFGHAMRSSIGTTGSCSSRRVCGLNAGLGFASLGTSASARSPSPGASFAISIPSPPLRVAA